MSLSTCEKSGCSVKSTALSALGVHFHVATELTRAVHGTQRVGDGCGAAFIARRDGGAITTCPREGSWSRPTSVLARQMKQLPPRGSLAESYWMPEVARG